MLLHTITAITQDDAQRLGLPLTMRMARFNKFIVTEIFPGGQLPTVSMVADRASEAGFTTTRIHQIEPNYVRTLQDWATVLAADKDAAIAVQSQEIYDRYDKYLNGCVNLFRDGYTSVHEYTLQI